jgi:tRNA(Ile)-lysidine synthase
LYHVAVHELAECVLTHIRRQELLGPGERVGVAVSGGIDSVALLRLLLELRGELGIVLSVVHFNHKLREGASDSDQEFVEGLAREFELEFFCGGDDTARFAAEAHCSVEAAARELRYGFFHRLLGADAGHSGAKARIDGEVYRSAESAAPPQSNGPQGLKPESSLELNGTSELVPFPSFSPAEIVSLPNHSPADVDPHASYIPTNSLNTICTGHTLDDQAETVLMRVIRGTGLRGLGAIHPRLAVEDESGEVCGEIVRPLLGFRRAELEAYLRGIGQSWREDASNADDRFTRNRVRHALLPLIEREFNPSVAENLSELAEIARDEEDYWENEAAGWMGRTVQWVEPEWVPSKSKSTSLTQGDTEEHRVNLPTTGLVQILAASDRSGVDSELESMIDSAPWLVVNGSVNLLWLLGEPMAVQRRVIKAMGQYVRLPLEFKHVEEILRFAAGEVEAGKELSLPLGWKMIRHPDELELVTPDLRQSSDGPVDDACDYEYELPVPGFVVIPQVRISLEARRVVLTPDWPDNHSDFSLDAESLSGKLKIRNWRPGDRFWPAHSKGPKKIKELLQGRAKTQLERKLWPVILSGEVIVWVRGFPVPARFQARPGREAVLITVRSLGDNRW